MADKQFYTSPDNDTSRQSDASSKYNVSVDSEFILNNEQQLEYLKSIDTTLKDLLKNSNRVSQSDARFGMPRRSDFQHTSSSPNNKWAPSGRYNRDFRNNSGAGRISNKGFFDSFEDALIEGFLGSDFKANVRESLNKFTDSIGISLKDIPGAAGKALGNSLVKALRNSSIGSQLFSTVDNVKNQAAGWAKTKAKQVLHDFGYDTSRKASNTEQFTSDSAKAATRSATVGYMKSKESAADFNRRVVEMSAQSVTITTASVILQQAGNDTLSNGSATNNLQQTSSDISPNTNASSVTPGKELATQPSINLSDQMQDIKSNFFDQAFDQVFDKFGSKFSTAFNSTKLGGLLNKGAGVVKDKALAFLGNTTAKLAATSSTAATGLSTASTAATAGTTATAELATLSSTASTAATALSTLGPYALAAVAAFIILTKIVEAFGPAIRGAQVLFDKLGESANRYQKSREENLKLAQERLTADVNAMIEKPFQILEDAAQRVYDAWDDNIRLINGTQGYNKADLQNLMSAYAERLRDEGLTAVVSGADITENLATVLKSGLSGKVAEEFAYIATKLNAAIPTQDFFGYSDTYASVAANAIARGMSESEAISYANEQLELFASNVLYASRQISGGFSSGLKDAENLFSQANKIAQTAKTGNTTEISGVLTAIAAATGAIAPDLATSMTDAIVNAATGGNSPEIVALRSLAGVNASNTEFLRQVATNPQKVFTTLFTNLADMQNMSNDAYMEVAEGLSKVFGISMDAFARIDFNYLANAISEMNVSNAELSDNMSLLTSGETTLTAEQLKMQQINKYMLEEGLAYVLDNEAARAIQENMWAEQRAREMMEATYGVELQGAALEFLEGIRQTVDNIVNLLNPLAWFKQVNDLVGTVNESAAQQADIRQLLELGKVGNGNAQSLYQLTTRNQDLNLVPNLITLMGGHSAYESAKSYREFMAGLMSPSLLDSRNLLNSRIDLGSAFMAAAETALTSSMSDFGSPESVYNWGTVGKSTSTMLLGNSSARGKLLSAVPVQTSTATAAAQSQVAAKIENMLSDEYIGKYIQEGKTYEQWAASASNFGIADFASAIQEAGYTETQLQGYFQSKETEAGAKESYERYQDEKDFWDKGRQFWIDEKELTSQLVSLVNLTNERLLDIINNQLLFHEYWKSYRNSWDDYHSSSDDHYDASLDYFDKWSEYYADWTDACKEWTRYFIDHEVYNDAYSYTDVASVQRKERQGSYDAVYALAEALTKNTVDLKDPAVQTNALLSEILLIVNAIMQQNNQTSGGTLSLPDTLAGMSLGLIKES